MQLPTLVLPDGRIVTESAAITLHLAEDTGRDDLAPRPPRSQFLRWLIFMVANIYPTFTYSDIPARFVAGEEAEKAFKANVYAYLKRLWGMMEAEAGAPWFLGNRFTALDLYIAVMTKWRPRRAWFAGHAPRLHAIAAAAEKAPENRRGLASQLSERITRKQSRAASHAGVQNPLAGARSGLLYHAMRSASERRQTAIFA
jgi:GST-like protein